MFDTLECRRRGAHYCEPRAERVVAFFAEILVHTKGDYARRRFVLEDWQADEIIRPLFGTVRFDDQRRRYVRRYTIAWIELGRKNGKSELGAGIALYLLVGDDEEGAEVYGAAKDRAQARKVWDVAERMRQLSPLLAKERGGRLGCNRSEKRIFDPGTASYYEIVTRDALGELGHNPHGIVFDEVIAQPDGDLWNAMRTAMGARAQALMVALTTAGNQPSSFAAVQHRELLRILEQPRRAPHVFVYMRNTPQDDEELAIIRKRYAGHPDLPVSCDPFDERNWRWANPALGTFLSIEALRAEALEAKNEPAKENPFRQYRLNQWVAQATRHMPLFLWDACGRQLLGRLERDVRGRCYGGLDLASTTDLASWALLFPGEGDAAKPHRIVWRFWTPEAQVEFLDRHTGGQFSAWVREGFVTVTEGDWIDFEQIRDDLEADRKRYTIAHAFYDPAMAPDTAQWLEKKGVDAHPHRQGYALSTPMQELYRLVKAQGIEHGGNPVARWNADGVETLHPRDDPDTIKPVKPERQTAGVRIDGYLAATMAVASYLAHGRRSSPAGSVPAAAAGGSVFDAGGPLEI